MLENLPRIMAFSRLVRYQAEDGIHYGDLAEISTEGPFDIYQLEGSIDVGFKRVSDNTVTAEKVCVFILIWIFATHRNLAIVSP